MYLKNMTSWGQTGYFHFPFASAAKQTNKKPKGMLNDFLDPIHINLLFKWYVILNSWHCMM